MGEVKYSVEAQAKIAAVCAHYSAFGVKRGERAMSTITNSLNSLAKCPLSSRPYLKNLNYRERTIPFGSSPFLALYCISETSDVIVVNVRHERELGCDMEKTA